MTIHWRSHWFWLVLVLTLVSIADYLDHIARPGSVFAADPFAWLAFTAASHTSFLVIAYAFSRIGLAINMPPLLSDTLGVCVATVAHLTLTGPLWDQLLWPPSELIFASIAAAPIAALGYLGYRGIFQAILLAVDHLRGRLLAGR